jgi:peptidoglycan/xylan/chitin deacetylase (PgdA/CDA1 family)
LRNRSLRLEERLSGILQVNEIEFDDIKSGILSIHYHHRHLLDEIAQVMDVNFDDYLLMNKPYLTSDQINSLIARGFTIGAHSIDHPFYPSLSLKDQLHQTVESVKEIREKFCLDYGAFAFPHSDSGVPEKFFIESYKSGLVDVSFGTGGMLDDNIKNHLQRFSLEKPSMPAKNIIAIQYARRIYKTALLGNPVVRG